MGIHLLQAALATIQAQADVIFVSLDTVARPLAVAAGLALVVERLTEVLKNVTVLVPTRDQAPALVQSGTDSAAATMDNVLAGQWDSIHQQGRWPPQ